MQASDIVVGALSVAFARLSATDQLGPSQISFISPSSVQPCPRPVVARMAEETVQSPTPDSAKERQEAAKAALASLTGPQDAATAGLAEVTRQVLMSDPETAEQLKRYQAALARVEAAKAAAAELEDIFKQAGREVAQREAQEQANMRLKANEVLANAEVEAAEKLLAAAQLEAAQAAELQAKISQEVSQNAERVETAKAGVAAIVGGAGSALPIVLASGASGTSAFLTLAAALGSCFLFGTVYRYAVRLDANNVHLRNGVVGGFGLVRAVAGGDVLQTSSPLGPLDIEAVVGPAALYAGQSMILFAFSAVAVEYAFRQGWIRRFGEPAAAARTPTGGDSNSSSSSSSSGGGSQ